MHACMISVFDECLVCYTTYLHFTQPLMTIYADGEQYMPFCVASALAKILCTI
jgi:hypothetical protein